jgi:hypothetical protein
MGILIDKKQKHKYRVLTEEKLRDWGIKVKCKKGNTIGEAQTL